MSAKTVPCEPIESKPRQRKRGRPTKATPERIEAILADIANGLTKEQACACNGVSATSFRKWEERPEFPDLRARAQGLRIKARLAKLEAAAESGNSAWKSYAWELEKIYRHQFGDTSVTICEQNNYQLSEERARAIEVRVQRLELEDSSSNREASNGAVWGTS
jgi:hypothetical protein